MRNGVTLAIAFAASITALFGWVRAPGEHPVLSVRIVDVRPLATSDAALRDRISHTFSVRVRITGWKLLSYQPGVTHADNEPGAGHWRLYLDGHPLGDNLGNDHVTYAYVPPGTHWIAAELSNADSTSLRPAVWSEPVILHVPRIVHWWQSGWHGSPEGGTPLFACRDGQRPHPAAIKKGQTAPPQTEERRNPHVGQA